MDAKPNAGSQPNAGDVRLILHRLDSLDKLLKEIQDKIDHQIEQEDDRIRTLEIRQAMNIKTQDILIASNQKEHDEITATIKRNDVIGAVLGAVGAWIAAVLTFLGLTHGGSP